MKFKTKVDNKKESHNENNINISTGQTKETFILEHLITTLETMNQSINRLDKTLGKLETKQDDTDKMLQLIIEKVLK